MAGGDIIIMVRQEELKRLYVIRKVLGGRSGRLEAAEILLLSSRQIRKIINRAKATWNRGMIHKARGRSSNRRFPNKVKKRTIKLYLKGIEDLV